MCSYTLCIRCFSRDWRVIDYGICDLMDLLTEIPDTTITITHQDTDTVISVPKRGQFKPVTKKIYFEVKMKLNVNRRCPLHPRAVS